MSADRTPERYRRLLAKLDEALDIPAPGREAWLETLPPEDADLRDELARLLERGADARALDQVEAGAGALAAAPDDDDGGHAPGDDIGGFVLERALGRGGMGTVWLARKAGDASLPPVALKMPALAASGRGAAERLAREGAILAALNHPGIARLLEAGTTSAGVPFLALEFVDGESLPAWCDARALGLRARLALFQRVLEAVAYAHGALVLHRDLKPANILVTATGEVKLLDFGIAKLMDDAGSADSTQLTRVAGRALTPDYASPEQVSGATLTVASDVYSLGITLFQLLTGGRPYRLRRGSAAELEEAILSAETVRPSAALEASFAGRLHESPARLRRALAGDLDTIVLKCLKKRPEERYATAAALREDIARYLDGRPVLARPDSAAYRARKFLARNWLAASAAAAVVASLAVGLAVALWQAGEAREQSRVALAEAHRAEEVKDFLHSLFRKNTRAQPDAAKARAMTVLELMRESVPRLRTALVDQPLTKAELLATVGEILSDLEERPRALELFGEASTILEGEAAASPELRFQVLAGLALNATIVGKREEALAAYAKLLALAAPGEKPSDEIFVKVNSVAIGSGMVPYADEVRRLEQALTVAERRFGGGALHFTVLARLALVHGSHAHWDAVERYATEAIRVFPGSGSSDYQQYLQIRGALAIAMAVRGRIAAAITHLAQTLSEFDRRYGPELPRAKFFRSVYAQFLANNGRVAEAEALLRAQVGDVKPGAKLDFSQLTSLNNLAVLRFEIGDLKEARRALTLVPDQAEQFAAVDRVGAMTRLVTLALVHQAEGRAADASATLAKVDALNDGKSKSFLQGNYAYRTPAARLRVMQRDPAGAFAILGFEGYRYGTEAAEPEAFSEEFVNVNTIAGRALLAAGRTAEARATIDRVIAHIRARTDPRDYPLHYPPALLASATIARAEGRAADCARDAGEVVRIWEGLQVAGSPWFAEARAVGTSCRS
ncbi:MAG: serine/threonine protein kinase [Betaproteobacteria bacterium]|nr:serine/threonine protein kinase [Betaproteobacteria bacterium]